MPIYRIVAAVNVATGHYDGYRPGDPLACVTIRANAPAPVVFSVDVVDSDAALDAMWEIGNSVTGDRMGNCWPRDVRSLSTGDVLTVFPPGGQEPQTWAVAPNGFDQVPTPIRSAWVRLDGTWATSRPALSAAPQRDTASTGVRL